MKENVERSGIIGIKTAQKSDLESRQQEFRELLDTLSPQKGWLDKGLDEIEAELFSRHSKLFMVLDSANSAAGIAQIIFEGSDIAKVENVVVRKTEQGKGLGVLLMRHIIKYAKDKGIKCMRLTSSREVAQNLYRKLGFKELGNYTKPNGKKTTVFELRF